MFDRFMKSFLVLMIALTMAFVPEGRAANTTLPTLDPAQGVAGSDLYLCRQSGDNKDKKCTVNQLKLGLRNGIPPNAPSAYNAYGDQNTYYTFFTASQLYPYLINQDLAGGLTNYTTPFGFDCDVVDQNIMPNSLPTAKNNPMSSWLPAVADPTYGAGTYAPHQAITHQCRIAGLTWMTTPPAYKTLGQSAGCVQTGTWANDSRYGGKIGVASNTNGSTLTCSVTTEGAPIYAWYQMSENDGGTFTYAVDGGSTTSVPTNAGNVFSYPVGTHHSVGAFRIPVTAGSHSVVFTVTSATNASNNVIIEGIGTAPGKAYYRGGPIVYYGGATRSQSDTYFPAAVAAFNADDKADAQQLAADGLGVVFVDIQQYVGNTSADVSSANPQVLTPLGQQHMADAFEGAMQFTPTANIPSVDPRNYGAACNGSYFINTYGSTDNHVTTTNGSPVISINGYTFKAGVATQTGGGDVGKQISIFGNNNNGVGPTTYILSVDTGANTATLGANMKASTSGAFAVMGGYPVNPSDPSTAADDTLYIQAASTAAAATGKKVFLPDKCVVHNLKLASGTLLEGSMGGSDYGSASPSLLPVTKLYMGSNGYAEDPHLGINIQASNNVRLKDFQMMCPVFPYLGFHGLTAAGIGSEANTGLYVENIVLDHVSNFLCPVEFGVPFGMNIAVGFTASISGNQMTVSSIDTNNFQNTYNNGSTSDWLGIGRTVTGAGVTASTHITAAPNGGGPGVYTLDKSMTVSSESMTSAAAGVFLSGQSRNSTFNNGGIDFNGDISDWVETGDTYTGGFTKCMWIGPNTGGSTGNGANRINSGRFEECNNGAVVLDNATATQFNDNHFQFNNGYAIQLKNSSNIQVTGGMMEGNGTDAAAAPGLSQINFASGGSNFSISGVSMMSPNFAGGGSSKYIFSNTAGSTFDWITLDGGDVRTGYTVAPYNWAAGAPTHFRLAAAGIAPFDNTNTFVSFSSTGNMGIGTATPNVNAALDMGANTSAIILPSGSTAQQPTPTNGMLRYNSSTPGLEAYYSSAWNAINTGAPTFTASSTNTLTNKTFDTAGTGNVFKINGVTVNAVTGNGAKVATGTGTYTGGDCASFDGNGNVIDAGGPCTTGGGGGTVAASTIGQVAIYTGSTTVTGGSTFTATSGVVTANSYIPASSSVPTSGLYEPSTDTPGIASSGALNVTFSSGGGINIANATAGMKLNGLNGLSFSSADSTQGASIGIGVSALSNIASSAAYKNTAIGYQSMSGALTTTGIQNTAVGYQALKSDTTGDKNVAIGEEAMLNNTARTWSVAVGYQALKTVGASGSQDQIVAVGAQALMSAGNGANNSTAVGAGALSLSTNNANTCVGEACGNAISTGAANTGLGINALSGVTTGTNNTAVGSSAMGGSGAVTGAGNTAVGKGSLAVLATTANNNTALGINTGLIVTTGATNTIIGANVGSTTLTTGTSNILIGTSSGVTTFSSAGSNYLNIGNMITGDMSKGILNLEGPTTVVSSCGTSPTLKAGSNDMSGEVTVGSLTATCTVSFANTHTAAPNCVVTPQAATIAFGYGVSTTALTVTATALGGTVFDYFCPGASTSTNPTP